MRLVVSMDTGGTWMPENVRKSHLQAAARWEADYLTLVSVHPDHIFTEKVIALSELTCERAIWLDGDVMVRSDCPNLFDLVLPNTIGGVCNVQEGTHNGQPRRYHANHWAYCAAKWASHFDEVLVLDRDLTVDLTRFINGGVIVFTPRYHAEIWRRCLEFDCQNPLIEQTMLNVAIRRMGMLQTILPQTYNRIGDQAWRSPMECYVQHLAGCRWPGSTSNQLRCRKQDVLAGMDWCISTAIAS